MPFTVTQCASMIRLTLGGNAPPELPTLDLVNFAGRHMCSMHAWRWLEGAEVPLATVASQNYIVLPADFSRPIALESYSINRSVCWVTREEMTQLRTSTATSSDSGMFNVCVAARAGSGSALPYYVLELFPTPASTNATAYRLVYKSQWTDLTSDTDYVPILPWLQNLFTLILQAHAQGYVREQQGSLEDRMAALGVGTLLRNAIREDKTKQTNHGQIKGAIPSYSGLGPWVIPSTVSGP
jgi:hypothetical protein